jgi:VanZ family protein
MKINRTANKISSPVRHLFCLLLLTLTIAWMVVIFCLSAQPAKESADTSRFFGRIAAEIFVPGYSSMTGAEQQELAEKLDYPVRKCAHATEYAILGFLLFATLTAAEPKAKAEAASEAEQPQKKRRTGISFFAGVLYAASDEFHQLYVPGRSGQFSDVLLDAGGVLAGMLFCFCMLLLLRKISGGKEKGKEKAGRIIPPSRPSCDM